MDADQARWEEKRDKEIDLDQKKVLRINYLCSAITNDRCYDPAH